jgi:hypothetical protein
LDEGDCDERGAARRTTNNRAAGIYTTSAGIYTTNAGSYTTIADIYTTQRGRAVHRQRF